MENPENFFQGLIDTSINIQERPHPPPGVGGGAAYALCRRVRSLEDAASCSGPAYTRRLKSSASLWMSGGDLENQPNHLISHQEDWFSTLECGGKIILKTAAIVNKLCSAKYTNNFNALIHFSEFKFSDCPKVFRLCFAGLPKFPIVSRETFPDF